MVHGQSKNACRSAREPTVCSLEIIRGTARHRCRPVRALWCVGWTTPEPTWSSGYRSYRSLDSSGAGPQSSRYRRDRRTVSSLLCLSRGQKLLSLYRTHPSQPQHHRRSQPIKKGLIVYVIFPQFPTAVFANCKFDNNYLESPNMSVSLTTYIAPLRYQQSFHTVEQ